MQHEILGLSQCLLQHPILNEKPQYKIKYLNVLEYFTNLYSKENEFAQSMLKTYKQRFLKDVSCYTYNENEIKKVFKKAAQLKLKGFKLFTYRYNLLFDCFFINAFNDLKKAKAITNAIGSLFSPRYFKRIEALYEMLYCGVKSKFFGLETQLYCWNENKAFFEKPLKKILITANMSAGKSTLINAMIGKKISKTKNEACTAKIHYIYNKPFEDGMSCEWDYALELDADNATLMDDNALNKTSDICVGTYFRLTRKSEKRICLIDTPGVNSFEYISHKNVTEKIINESNYDMLVYVMNAENSGTFDDRKHLSFILENVRNKPIVFVINKLDTFNKYEDDIDEIISSAEKELLDMGFENPIICPLSAYAAILAKKMLQNEFDDEDEQIEYAINRKRFADAEYDLSKYGDNVEIKTSSDSKKDQATELLKRAGFINFENILCK